MVVAVSKYTITRGTQTVATNILIEVQPQSVQEQADEGGAGPYMLYDGYIRWLAPTISLMQGDLITDQQNIDPLTTTGYALRVANDPYRWQNNYVELSLKHYRGI